jgi:hypothetical protein
MTHQESIERRMAALFVIALGLILWQAPRTRPLQVPQFASVLQPGDQLFPVAVPPDAPPQLPSAGADRLAFLMDHSVAGFAAAPADACPGFVRISAQHWVRLPVSRPVPPGLYHLAAPDGAPAALRLAGGEPLAAGDLAATSPGPEVEVFCPR